MLNHGSLVFGRPKCVYNGHSQSHHGQASRRSWRRLHVVSKPPTRRFDEARLRVLIERVRLGDTDAEREMFDALTPGLLAVAHARFGRAPHVDDAVQDTLIAVLKHVRPREGAPGRAITGSPVAFLHVALRRHVARLAGGDDRRSEVELDETRGALEPAWARPPDAEILAEVGRVLAALLKLPGHFAVTLHACELRGETVNALASDYGQLVPTVKGWRKRGRARLLRELGVRLSESAGDHDHD